VSGVLKAVTAVISVATLVLLVRITPTILKIPDQLAHQRFRELIENAPDAILQVDARGTIVIANHSAEQIFGYTREELIGSNVDLLIPIGTRGAHAGHRDGFMHAGVVRSMGEGLGDLHARRKDGTEVCVEIALSPVKTEDGMFVTAVIRDVTERKLAEKKLEEARRLADRRYRDLIEDAPDAIVQVDAQGTIVIANRTAEMIFGYTREELLGSNVDLLIPMGNRGAHPGHRDGFVRGGVTRPMGEGLGDLHARRKDGSEISVEIALSRLQADEGVHVTAVIRDVTERMRIERELERTRLRLASVLDNTSVGVYAVDRDWMFTYVNENARKLLREMGDVMGRDLRTAFPDQRASTYERLEHVMSTRLPVAFESYYPPLDLSTNISAHPLDDGGITIYFTDISAQRRMERELELERAQRNQRIEVLARLSSGLAHEIKNPLAIIHARASDLKELAETGEVDRVEIKRACASIVHTSDRAIRILRGVAAMARVGTHETMQPEAVDGLVQQAVELVQGRFNVAGIGLQVEVPKGLPLLECREVQIGQILVNLLNNAFDAVDGDARNERWVRVAVSLQGDAEHEDHVERLQISVIDSGPGVAPEHKERLMQTFFTTKSMGAGIGIGLSVSRTIAEDHGGQLELRECDGHTCFCLTLPVKAGQEVIA
jgi:PAS domain S-box-containing protein